MLSRAEPVADRGSSPSPRPLQRSRSQSIVPCTVSQLLAAEQVDEAFRIHDVEISQVGTRCHPYWGGSEGLRVLLPAP